MSHLCPSTEDVHISISAATVILKLAVCFCWSGEVRGWAGIARFTLPVWAVVLDEVRHVFIPRALRVERKHRLHNGFGNLREQSSGLNSRLWG